MASDISALISALSCWELAGYAALAAVVVGVIGESIHEFIPWFGSVWWRTNGGKASALLLIAGLAAEGITQVKTNSISGQIIAFLNERAGRLEKEAADAKERAALIQRAAAWRRITSDQSDKLIQTLSKKKLKVLIAWIGNDPESLFLADQFAGVFKEAEWGFTTSARIYFRELFLGDIRIPSAGSQDAVQIVREALMNADIHFSTQDVPGADITSGATTPEDDSAMIFIGSKQPGFVQPPH